jgi:heat shock protein HspQ
MHYNTEHAISKAAMADLGAIRRELKDDGYYHLRAANGERRVIASGSANTAWANAGWPKRGANAVIWWHAKPVTK